ATRAGSNASLLTLLEEKAPTILREHEETETLSISSRKFLVKVAVSDLVEKHGYPSVFFFWSFFFDWPSHSGFIEMRLRNIRGKLQQIQRMYSLKRRYSTQQPSESPDETVPSEWLTLIKRMRPSPEIIPSIKNAIDQTYSYRRRWIKTKSPTVAEIFKEYPRFLDMPALLTDGKENLFIRKWEGTIIPKLEEMASLEKKMDIRHLLEKANSQHDDGLCYAMLKILIHLLPPTASGRSVVGSKCCVKFAVSYLLEQM
ncbi:uncharacterized protein DAT39_018201, partial [Clarias magur]